MHLDMIDLTASSLVLLERAHRQLGDLGRHSYIVRVADPEVAVHLLLLDVRDELLPRFLLVVENLLGFFGAEGCGVFGETAPLVGLAVLVLVSICEG